MHTCQYKFAHTHIHTHKVVYSSHLKAKASSHDVLIGSNDGDILQDDGVLALQHLSLVRVKQLPVPLVLFHMVLIKARHL